MGKQRFRKGLAGGLAALMLLQAMPMGASAWSIRDWFGSRDEEEETAQVEVLESREAQPQLKDGTAVIPVGSDAAAVKEILGEALVVNADEVDAQSLEWEYYCTGRNWTSATKKNWGSIFGFETGYTSIDRYTYPALADNEDGNYQVRLEGDTGDGVILTKVAKLQSSITLDEDCTVALPYQDDATVDYDALREDIWDEVVESTTPSDLTVDDVTIEYYATAPGSVGSLGKAWMPLEGGKASIYTYPAISQGEQKIRISYAGSETHSGTSAETTVTIAERPQAPYTLKAAPDPVTLVVDENLETDYAAIHDAIFAAVVESSEVLTADNVTITYYYKGVTDLDSKWLPLEGQDVVGSLGYPAISEGDHQIRISWPGDQTYAPTTIEATVTVNDREQIQFNLKNGEGPYEVSMVFTADQGYDYEATAQAIYEAVVASTTPISLTADDVTVEYNATLTGATDQFKPLDGTDWTGLKKFGTGTWEIRISWPGNQQYRGSSVIVDVTTTDSRLESSVALKSGVSFTYNMYPSVMEQAIFDNVIDWDSSILPAKETLSLDDFTIEYYGENILSGNINGGVKQWAPIGGGTVTLLTYPQMGAGENQQIRVSFHGNADYRPSDSTEGAVTVNKATVKVSVHSDNIYADEALPEGFITTDPADDFDQYVIYAGITSNVTTALYLDLPDRYTAEGSLLLKLVDQALEAAGQKTLTQMLNEGITLGELRELLSTQELLGLLDKLNIDTGTFGQILEAVNKMPGILDSVRISFGAPSRAGLYTVAVVTDNQNYETGFGMGFLLVKMRLSGVNLTWNEEIQNGKLTAEEAKTFDFSATLSYDGVATDSQESVSYLYSGFTSKWRVYSSTTTPPTEPGRYVMTVVTLGGNYQAAPITRSFQITK